MAMRNAGRAPGGARDALAAFTKLAGESEPGAGQSAATQLPLPPVAQWTQSDVSQRSATLAWHLRGEWTAFRAADVARIVQVCGKLSHAHRPLLDAVAIHVQRGLVSYPLWTLCTVANCFARLDYQNARLMDTIASHLAAEKRASQLSPIDIGVLVFAYAEFRHSAGELLQACATRLQACGDEVGGPNCASILNSYARLSECNPDLFHSLARSVIRTKPGSFDVHHISLVMNAFAKCSIRKKHMMHLLADQLSSRVPELSPQNMTNVVNAFARLDCYSHELFAQLQIRIAGENLQGYKLFELATLTHSLAKLRCGGERLYGVLFAECTRRDRAHWEPQAVAQVLDGMRRRKAFYSEGLALLLMQCFLETLQAYGVHPLTQASWCFVELEALPLAERMPEGLLATAFNETPSRCFMRLVFVRMDELGRNTPLTPTQRCYVQQLVRAYRYKNEVDFGLQPMDVRAFCKSVFDVPSSVISAAATPLNLSRRDGRRGLR